MMRAEEDHFKCPSVFQPNVELVKRFRVEDAEMNGDV